MSIRWYGYSGKFRLGAERQWAGQPLPVEAAAPPAAGMPDGDRSITNNIARRQFGYSEVVANILLTTLAVAAVSVTLREALYTQQNKRVVQQVEQAPNTTLRMAGTVTQAPFSQDNWPNPPTIKRTQTAETPNTTLRMPVVVAGAPFAQEDWPNPQRARNNQWGFDYSVTATTLQIVPYHAADSQWPNPQLRAAHRQTWDSPNVTVNLPTSTPPSTDNVRTPLITKRIVTRQQNVFDSPNVTIKLPAGVVQSPFNQTDWPNPKLRAAHRQLWDQPNVTITLPIDPLTYEYAPSDNQWPNPHLFKPRKNTSDFLPVNLLPIVSATGYSYSPSDNQWANPKRSQNMAAYLSTDLNLLTSTLTPDTPPAPGECDYHRRYRRISYR